MITAPIHFTWLMHHRTVSGEFVEPHDNIREQNTALPSFKLQSHEMRKSRSDDSLLPPERDLMDGVALVQNASGH
jgi:hypothetical protein